VYCEIFRESKEKEGKDKEKEEDNDDECNLFQIYRIKLVRYLILLNSLFYKVF